MGIKRCPYCRALISDEDQYCKNCGTQLLFPEDEEIEEEIPGDKIVEDNRDRDESTEFVDEELTAIQEEEEEFSEVEEDTFKGEGQEEEVEEELEEENEIEDTIEDTEREEAELEKETIEEAEEEEEVILVDEEISDKRRESEELKSFTRPTPESPTTEEILFGFEEKELPFPEEENREESTTVSELSGKTQTLDLVEKVEKIEKEVLGEDSQTEITGAHLAEKKGPGLVTQLVQELGIEERGRAKKESLTRESQEKIKIGKTAVSEDQQQAEQQAEKREALTFETAELSEIGPTVEMGKRQVEDFFKILEEKEKERLKEKQEQLKKGTSEETGEVPSWIKEIQTTDLETGTTELIKTSEEELIEGEEGMIETETGEEWVEEETPSEPTIGFPERVTRSQIEIEKIDTGEEEIEFEEQAIQEEPTGEISTGEIVQGRTQEEASSEESSTAITLPPLGFKNFVKAKIFDFLFIVLFWLVSIWLAARSLGVTIFKLLEVASNGLLIYLLILTAVYFFLFYFFIGETLGDRLFREDEEKENL